MNGTIPINYNFQKMEYHIFPNKTDYIIKAAETIESFLMHALNEKPILRIALSGGKGPLPIYKLLSKSKRIPWSRITFFLADERYVPLNSKDSNYKMIREVLADQVKNLRRFYHYNTRDPIPTIVDQYQKMLQQFEPPLFDLVLLGVGTDGHTASLFPHESALHENTRLVMHTVSPDPNTRDRLSLTFPAILDSQKIIFLIQGADKKEILNRWLHEKNSIDDLPAQKILEHPDVEIFYSP